MKHKLIIYGCLGIVLWLIILIPIVNDYCAYTVEKKLCATPLPESTELVDSLSMADKLTGNKNSILDIFAYSMSTKDVISSSKTSWSATGSDKYYEYVGHG